MVGSVEGTRIIHHDTFEWSERYKPQTVKKRGEMHCKILQVRTSLLRSEL